MCRWISLEGFLGIRRQQIPDLGQLGKEPLGKVLRLGITVRTVHLAPLAAACKAEPPADLLGQDSFHLIQGSTGAVFQGLGSQLGGAEIAGKQHRPQQLHYLPQHLHGGHGDLVVVPMYQGVTLPGTAQLFDYALDETTSSISITEGHASPGDQGPDE